LKLLTTDATLDTAVNTFEVFPTPFNKTPRLCFFDDFVLRHDSFALSRVHVVEAIFTIDTAKFEIV
jgi:hypothetical protein